MVEYMSLEEQVDRDFERARWRAFRGALWARLRGRRGSERLLPFDEVRRKKKAVNGFHVGRRIVQVDRIVGSVGRYGDFDAGFMPARASLGGRWKAVDRAFHRARDLPPVSLYKVGDRYFVRDGHHRVSVARFWGIDTIEADVTEYRAASYPLSDCGPLCAA